MSVIDPLLDIEFLHVCYVTQQFDAARDVLRSGIGAKSFLDLGVIGIDTEAGHNVTIRLGMGYLGPSYVELIEPRSGPLDFYREALRGATSPLIWHHCCYAVRTMQAMRTIRAFHESAGRQIVVASRDGKFFYADTRSLGGHYTEYVLMDADLTALHDAVRLAASPAGPMIQACKGAE